MVIKPQTTQKHMPKKKTYSSMTKAQKRVAIAKDVLLQIKLGKYIAVQGTYISPIGEHRHEVEVSQYALKARSRLDCRVCAKGALALSAIRKFNKYEGTAETIYYDHMEVIGRFFGIKQANMIESAFEMFDRDGASVQNYRERKNISDSDDDESIISIMKNIIKNNGTFKP